MRVSAMLRTAKLLRYSVCVLAFGALVLVAANIAPARQAEAATPPQYIKFDRLVLPVIRRKGLEGHLFLVIYIELNDLKDRPLILSKQTPLRDEYIRALNRHIAHRPRILYNVSLPELKALLLKASARIVGDGKIKAILVQAAANRRF